VRLYVNCDIVSPDVRFSISVINDHMSINLMTYILALYHKYYAKNEFETRESYICFYYWQYNIFYGMPKKIITF
jgi:hypothetical protein